MVLKAKAAGHIHDNLEARARHCGKEVCHHQLQALEGCSDQRLSEEKTAVWFSKSKMLEGWGSIKKSNAISPLVVPDGAYDTQNKRPAGPEAVPMALQDLKDTLQLFLTDVCMENVGQFPQRVQQQKL